MKHTVTLGLLLISLSACGGNADNEAPKTPVSATNSSPTNAARPAGAQGPLTRTQVKATVAEGLGAFLQNVDLDDRAVFADGKFHGFRVLALRDGLAKSGLQPGDVVVSVNKMPIERPEQALAVFRNVESANEVRVDYERNGEPKTLTVPIFDDGSASGPVNDAAPNGNAPTPRTAATNMAPPNAAAPNAAAPNAAAPNAPAK